MRDLLPPLALLGVLLLAGCSSSLQADGTTSATTGVTATTDSDGNVVPVGNATAPPIEKGEPVAIDETHDMTQAGSADYTWDVKNGYRAFTVSFETNGAGGAPLTGISGLGYHLAGGSSGKTYAEASGGPTSFNGGSPGCQLCFDAAGKDPNEMAGPWSLHVEWGPSAAEGRVHVEVVY